MDRYLDMLECMFTNLIWFTNKRLCWDSGELGLGALLSGELV